MTNVNLNQYMDSIKIEEQLQRLHLSQLISNEQQLSETKLITEWLDSASKKPFIIYGYKGVGKTYFLTQLRKVYNQKSEKKGSNKSKIIFKLMDCRLGNFYKNFSHQLYNFLSSIRKILAISKVIQIQQQRIRKYFYYWIFKIEEALKAQIMNQNQQVYSKVVLIIHGIQYLPRKSIYQQLKFFLPKEFTQNFKVIIVLDRSKDTYIQALKYFKQFECPRLELGIQNSEIILNQIQQLSNQKVRYMISRDLKDTHFFLLKKMASRFDLTSGFVKSFVYYLIPSQDDRFYVQQISELDYIYQNISYDVIEDINNQYELLQYILKYMEGNFKKKIYWKYFFILYITYKGIQMETLKNLTNSTMNQVKLFYTIFRNQFIRFSQKDILFIHDQNLKNQIKIQFDLLSKQEVCQLHNSIYQQLSKHPYSIQKLQECLYHLYLSENYFRLKQQIIKVQHFLILFKCQSKFLLFKYWRTLIQKGYDPVIDYNKSLEYFIMQYLPSPQSLYDILFLFACFFRQMCQFQNYNTPTFRHHKIIGSIKQFKQLGIYEQMVKLNLIQIRENKTKNDEHYLLRNTPDQNISKKIQELHQLKSQKKIVKQKLVKTILRKNQESLNLHQKLNPNIPQNIAVFKKHFQQIIDSFKNPKTQNDQYFYNESIEQQQVQKNQNQQIPTFEYIKTQQQFRKPEIKYYYYKRWLWTKFPLLTLSIWKQFNRSIAMILNPDQISLDEEKNIYESGIRLVISVKEHRKNIMSKFEITDQMIKNKIRKSHSRTNITLSFQDIAGSTTFSLKRFSSNRDSKTESNNMYKRERMSSAEKKVNEYLRTSSKKDMQSKYGSLSRKQNNTLKKTQFSEYFTFDNYDKFSLKATYNKLVYQYKKLKQKFSKLEKIRLKKENEISQKMNQLKQPKSEPEKINLLRSKQRQYFIKLIEKSRFDLVKSICQQNNPISKEHLESYIQYSHNLKSFLEIEKENFNKLRSNLRQLFNLKKQYSDILSIKESKNIRTKKINSNFSKMRQPQQENKNNQNEDTVSIYYKEIQKNQVDDDQSNNWIRLDKVQMLIKNIQKKKILKQKIQELEKIQQKLIDETPQQNQKNELNQQKIINEWELKEPILQQYQKNIEMLKKIQNIIDMYQLE